MIASPRSAALEMPYAFATTTALTPMSPASAVPPRKARVAPVRAIASASTVGTSGNFSISSLYAVDERYERAP